MEAFNEGSKKCYDAFYPSMKSWTCVTLLFVVHCRDLVNIDFVSGNTVAVACEVRNLRGVIITRSLAWIPSIRRI
jgi:hypothetical protein